MFLDRERLKLENAEYKKITENYKTLISNYSKNDSLRIEQIDYLSNEIMNCEDIIVNQNETIYKLNNKNKLWKGLTIGGFTISATLLILLLIK